MRIYLFLLVLFFLSCQAYKQELDTACRGQKINNATYSKEVELIAQFEQLLNVGVPGIAVAIYSREGWWQYAGGFAKIEDQTSMETCHLHYLQSIAKLYQATAILKLYEEGKIDLDKSINSYLSAYYANRISRSDEISVRMLLQHSSGIPEYNSHPINITQLLQTPRKFFTTKEYLEVINKKPLDFEPDSRYSYRNSNYELLALIADEITGDHAKHISEMIFQPLRLEETFYRNETGYLEYSQLYNCYWDRHSDGILENISQMQRTNVSSMIGDDGIVSTPKDAVLFLKGLFEGKIIKEETLELMKQGFVLQNGSIEYGLGLDRAVMGGEKAFGHSGGGLGAGCQLYYFPHNATYFFLGINMGTITEGKITDKALPILDEIHSLLAK